MVIIKKVKVMPHHNCLVLTITQGLREMSKTGEISDFFIFKEFEVVIARELQNTTSTSEN